MYDTCGILDAHHLLLGRGLRTSEVLKLRKKSSLVKLQIGLVEILVWNGFLGICGFEETCKFFWHGSQHGAATCRLFSGCEPWFGSSVWKATDGNGDMEHSRHSRQMEEMSLVCFFFGNAEHMAIMHASGWVHAHAPILELYESSGCFSRMF